MCGSGANYHSLVLTHSETISFPQPTQCSYVCERERERVCHLVQCIYTLGCVVRRHTSVYLIRRNSVVPVTCKERSLAVFEV